MNETNETIGDYSNIINLSSRDEYLQLGFQPFSLPLKERWRNNGLSADFMADYVTTFFPKNENDPESITRQAEIKSAVSYIANELLENAMKYSDEGLKNPTRICLFLQPQQIIITETNVAAKEQAKAYKSFVIKLNEGDPMEMFLEQLEASAMEDNVSGLGFLTMLNDYNAELAWEFTPAHESSLTTITTEVRIPI
jgi:hypothetical protein